MAKTKRRHLAAIAAKKDAHPVDSKNKCSPLPRQETDFQDEEDSWVHVRKQRVIIWIPPLPAATQAPTQVERIKQREIVPGTPAKRARRISRKRSRTESTADTKNVGNISRKRSTTHSTPDTKNARRTIRKAILKARSRQEGRILEGKDTNAEVSQNPLPSKLPRTKTAAVKKAAAQGASRIPSCSTVHQDNEPNSGNRESISTKDMTCKLLLLDNLQVPDGKVSQTVQKNRYSSRSSAKHKRQRRETEMNYATNGDSDNCYMLKEQERKGSQLPPVKNGASFGMERNCQNGEEAEAIRSSDAYPQDSPKPVHLSPASLVPSGYRLLDHIKLQQRSSAEFDRSMVGPSVFFPNKSLEQESHEYDPRFIPSLQCASVGLFRSSTTLASERISSAAMHSKLSQGNSACMNATRETNFFASDDYVNTSALDNRSKRVLILKKNLAKEGGLRRWLVSKGLVQFVDIFQREKVDEFHLLQLTMATLKEMGAYAVGPRRKLIHAIDCLSQPYHSRAF